METDPGITLILHLRKWRHRRLAPKAPSQIQNEATFLRNSASGSSSEELCPPLLLPPQPPPPPQSTRLPRHFGMRRTLKPQLPGSANRMRFSQGFCDPALAPDLHDGLQQPSSLTSSPWCSLPSASSLSCVAHPTWQLLLATL